MITMVIINKGVVKRKFNAQNAKLFFVFLYLYLSPDVYKSPHTASSHCWVKEVGKNEHEYRVIKIWLHFVTYSRI